MKRFIFILLVSSLSTYTMSMIQAENILILSCEHLVTNKYNAFSDLNELKETNKDPFDSSLEINLDNKTAIPGGSMVKHEYKERGNEILWSNRLKVSERTENIWVDVVDRVSGSWVSKFSWCTDNQCKIDTEEFFKCEKAKKIF